ncbi:hypothetical protein PISMIDRAFT_421078 [Pisolithus microcarpus 441]|uniref:Uncharacterized protein n=1 Tax=Pisolithus microcarpus 441 TaxID=765257 RepID=A0A0C9ZDP3_9AGAM|nr:hypothetical protein PISMIDRAFT_421078 [Pisolithus microcarpus 441]
MLLIRSRRAPSDVYRVDETYGPSSILRYPAPTEFTCNRGNCILLRIFVQRYRHRGFCGDGTSSGRTRTNYPLELHGLTSLNPGNGRPGGSSSILVLVTMIFTGRSYTFAMLSDFRTTCVGTLENSYDPLDLQVCSATRLCRCHL